MLYYIRKYPVSLLIILTVIYLSFFKPPQTEMESIPGIDKVVHVCMWNVGDVMAGVYTGT